MKAAWREANERAEVREAVEAWREASLLDDGAVAGAAPLWTPEGPRLGRLWRVLLFVFVLGAVQSAFAFILLVVDKEGIVSGRQGYGLVALLWGVALAVATERILDRTRYAATGAAGACATAASVLLTAGPLLLLLPDGVTWQIGRFIAGWAAIVLAGCAVRWGMWPFAGGAAAAFLLLLATFPGGRGLWLAAAPALAWGAWATAGRAGLPRPHRRSAEAVFAAAAAAVALAANVFSLDQGWLEHLELHETWRQAAPIAAGSLTRTLSGVVTAAVPLILLGMGLRGRRRVALDLAVLAAAAAAVTARAYWHIADLWLILAGSGALIVLTALGLIRWLAAGPGGERGGFTAEALYSDRRREELLTIAAALAATPAAQAAPGGRMEGEGGKFGGGGASATY